MKYKKVIIIVLIILFGSFKIYFGYIGDKRRCKRVLLENISKDGLALKDYSFNLNDDKEVVLAAVNNNGNALQYASKSLQSDTAVVLAAFIENGHSLKYADKQLQNYFLMSVNYSEIARVLLNNVKLNRIFENFIYTEIKQIKDGLISKEKAISNLSYVLNEWTRNRGYPKLGPELFKILLPKLSFQKIEK